MFKVRILCRLFQRIRIIKKRKEKNILKGHSHKHSQLTMEKKIIKKVFNLSAMFLECRVMHETLQKTSPTSQAHVYIDKLWKISALNGPLKHKKN